MILLSECDIEYISPSDYHPPEMRVKETHGKTLDDADDAYQKLVRKSLKQVEKQKVIEFY